MQTTPSPSLEEIEAELRRQTKKRRRKEFIANARLYIDLADPIGEEALYKSMKAFGGLICLEDGFIIAHKNTNPWWTFQQGTARFMFSDSSFDKLSVSHEGMLTYSSNTSEYTMHVNNRACVVHTLDPTLLRPLKLIWNMAGQTDVDRSFPPELLIIIREYAMPVYAKAYANVHTQLCLQKRLMVAGKLHEYQIPPQLLSLSKYMHPSAIARCIYPAHLPKASLMSQNRNQRAAMRSSKTRGGLRGCEFQLSIEQQTATKYNQFLLEVDRLSM
jgi:hypothetical protein